MILSFTSYLYTTLCTYITNLRIAKPEPLKGCMSYTGSFFIAQMQIKNGLAMQYMGKSLCTYTCSYLAN